MHTGLGEVSGYDVEDQMIFGRINFGGCPHSPCLTPLRQRILSMRALLRCARCATRTCHSLLRFVPSSSPSATSASPGCSAQQFFEWTHMFSQSMPLSQRDLFTVPVQCSNSTHTTDTAIMHLSWTRNLQKLHNHLLLKACQRHLSFPSG